MLELQLFADPNYVEACKTMKNLTFVAFNAVSLIAAPVAGLASQWAKVSEEITSPEQRKVVYYYNPTNVVSRPANVKSVWVLENFEQPLSHVMSIESNVDIYCDERAGQTVTFIMYDGSMGQGKVIRRSVQSQTDVFAIRESFPLFKVMQNVCKK
jgi:hypothetical protein